MIDASGVINTTRLVESKSIVNAVGEKFEEFANHIGEYNEMVCNTKDFKARYLTPKKSVLGRCSIRLCSERIRVQLPKEHHLASSFNK